MWFVLRQGSVSLSLCYLCHLLEVVMAFLQSSRSVQRLPYAAVFVEENLAVLLHPVQHLRHRQVETVRLTWTLM